LIFINSPLSQFEVTNLIGIFAPILGKINIILINLALYIKISICTSLDLSFLGVFFIIFLFCDILLSGFGFIISYSGKKILDAVIRNAGAIGTGVVGVVTGLDSAFNLADRMKKGGGSSNSDESDPDKDKDKDRDKNKKEEDNNNNTENKDTENKNTKS